MTHPSMNFFNFFIQPTPSSERVAAAPQENEATPEPASDRTTSLAHVTFLKVRPPLRKRSA